MDHSARRALMGRGLADIFDPDLRSSIVGLIDDVRERGDTAVCDALARFDGIRIEPDGLRVSEREIDGAEVSESVDRTIDF